jgi:carboxymethylenebutenolidase
MPDRIRLRADDGFELDAYRAPPTGSPRGGVVVLQEIFGVNAYVRSVADRFAAEGWLAIAPSLFDRAERGVELGYDQPAMARGRELAYQLPLEQRLPDIAAAVAAAAVAGKVGVVGFCWGGSLAALAAMRLPGLACAVAYYGSQAPKLLQQAPPTALMLHFGELDQGIPLAEVEALRARCPTLPLFTYPAGHGFACDARASYDRVSAELANERTRAFLEQRLSA